jgi:Acidobacterial duplicated orphan permease
MDRLIQDVRYAFRQLRKSPGFTITAVLTLALGIGANTAIYSLLDQVILRSLPVKDPSRLVMLKFTGSDTGRMSSHGGDQGEYFSYPMYRDVRDQNKVFSGLIATAQVQVGVQWHNQPELVEGELVSGNYFDVLGVVPAAGRLFVQSDDEVQERNPVVVISYSYWQRRFGSDPHVVNDNVSINGHPFTVIGVSRPGFRSAVVGTAPDIFVPMMMKPQVTPGWNDLDNHRSRWLNVIGRLKPGLSLSQAESGLAPLWHSLRQDELKSMGTRPPSFIEGFVTKSTLKLLDGSKGFSPLRDDISAPLTIVMVMVGLVVLIACANVASLLLVRAAGRMREMSVRYALGATRLRIMQQMVIEGLVLGIAGGILGMLLAPQITQLLLRKMWTDSIGQMPFSSAPDLRILGFNFALSLVVGLAFSLAPGLQFWRPNLLPLKQQVGTSSGGQLRLRRGSVAIQIGLSLILLFGAGLFVRTLHNLKNVNIGFSSDHLVTFAIEPSLAGYDPTQNPQVYKQILDRLSAMPGVRAVAATNDPELAGNNEGANITIAGYTPADDDKMNVEVGRISPHYFSTLQMPVLAGRDFTDADNESSAKVAVVNESLAKHFFGDAQHAIGHYFGYGGGGKAKIDVQIVGVVGDVKHTDLRTPIVRTVFSPYPQTTRSSGDKRTDPDVIPGMSFYVRTWQSPEAAMTSIRRAMQDLDPKLVLDSMQTMDQQIQNELSPDAIVAFLAAAFGVLATFLAAVGLYGVLAYSTCAAHP